MHFTVFPISHHMISITYIDQKIKICLWLSNVGFNKSKSRIVIKEKKTIARQFSFLAFSIFEFLKLIF